MNAERIAAKVVYGYAKAGAKLGLPHDVYRPTGTGPALAPQNLLWALPFASSATPDNSFRRPSKFSEDARFGLLDTALVAAGDYIDGPTGTFFVTSLLPFEPRQLTACNVVVSGARATGIQPGLNATYGGRVTATDVLEFSDWPASLRSGGSSDAGRAMLPGDPKRFSGALCKLPTIPGVMFRAGDRILVKDGDTYMISGAFYQAQGWELTLASVEA